jgi:hypothetical protein
MGDDKKHTHSAASGYWQQRKDGDWEIRCKCGEVMSKPVSSPPPGTKPEDMRRRE